MNLRLGVRSLLRDKGWTAVVVASLALGIGANTALFSAINGLFLRKLPVKAPDTLVRLRWVGRNEMATDSSDYGPSRRLDGQTVRATVSYPMYLRFVQDNRTMDALFACAPYGRANIVVDGRAEIANAFITTGNYYRMLGLMASPGRTILPDDDRPDATPVAVISERYWRTRFGGDPGIVGKAVRFNNVPVTIVGVITPELIGVQQVFAAGPDIAVPLALDAQLGPAQPAAPGVPSVPRLSASTVWWLQVMGRLRPGVTAGQVQADLASTFQNTARSDFDVFFSTLPATTRSSSRFQNRTQVPRLLVEPGARGIYDVNQNDERSVRILGAVVVLVLLIVCANVANLLLSRATTRQKEISIRLSLGATRGRLIRQLLTESVLLAAVGGTLGLLVAKWSSQLLPGSVGRAVEIDWRVLSFVLAVTVLTGIAFGIAPARHATSMNVGAALKETSRSVAGSRSRLTKGLLVVQVAVSLVLLIAAGLFLRTLNNLRHVDVGFNTQNLVLFRLAPGLSRYDDVKTAALVEQVTARLEAIPGVRAVAVSNVPLLSNSVNATSFFREGHKFDSINVLQISPDYFKTMEMPLVSGRGFTERDNQAAPKVAVINEMAARTYFPGENPVGVRIGTTAEQSGQIEVVGVLHDAKYDTVRGEVPPTMYIPHLQARPATMFHVRTAVDPATSIGAIREAVRQIDPGLPLIDLATQADQIDKNLQQERVFAQAYAIFGALAVLIASVGLFGLMSYSVARRTNEIGIRMALGARGQDVVALVMGESMLLVAIGVAIGVVTALAAGRLITSLLFGLAATDAPTILGAVLLILLVSAIAGYVPARRAARVDPLVALHYE